MIRLNVTSRRVSEMIEITSEVRNAVRQSGVRDGMVQLFVPHTTAAVTINENADPDVVHDMLKALGKVVPSEDDYLHVEGNSAAHLKSSFFGASELVPLEEGELALGTWQGIYFCEFDGPRNRRLLVNILPA